MKLHLGRRSQRLFSINSPQDAVFHDGLLPATIPSWSGTHSDIKKLIVYRDSDLVVVYKPCGVLTCQENASPSSIKSTSRNNLLDMLQLYIDSGIRDSNRRHKVGLVHRLDSPSSGLVVFSLTKAALQSLNEAFRSRAVNKKYLCVVNGEIPAPAVYEDYLLKTNSAITKVISNPGNRTDVVPAALTLRPLYTINYTIKAATDNANAELPGTPEKKQTLCEVTLHTGRKHQIRAQLAYRSHPLVGDAKYGAPQKFQTKDIALHAHKLEFAHPRTEKPLKFLCPPPRVWAKRFGEDCMNHVHELIAN
eukprot:gene33486-40516_t